MERKDASLFLKSHWVPQEAWLLAVLAELLSERWRRTATPGWTAIRHGASWTARNSAAWPANSDDAPGRGQTGDLRFGDVRWVNAFLCVPEDQ